MSGRVWPEEESRWARRLRVAAEKSCSIDNCDHPPIAQGLRNAHYKRLWTRVRWRQPHRVVERWARLPNVSPTPREEPKEGYGMKFSDEVVQAAYPVLDKLLCDLDATALRRDAESAIREMLDAAADALAVDAAGEVARLRGMLDILLGRYDREIARADAAEARLAEVSAIVHDHDYPAGAIYDIKQLITADSTETVAPADEAVDHE